MKSPQGRSSLQRRERVLFAGFAGVILVWVIILPLVRRTVLGPLDERTASLKAERATLELREDRQLEQMLAGQRLADWQARSLPPEPLDAQRLYQSWLTDLAQSSGLTKLEVAPDARSRKGDVYTSVKVSIKAEATLDQLARFLYDFHRTDLLHAIARMDLKSQGTSPQSLLAVVIVAEGVSLHDAPPRDRLFPQTTLESNVTPLGNVLTIAGADGFPEAVDFQVRIGQERAIVRAMNERQWTVQRAAHGTAAAPHSAGAAVELLPINPVYRERTLDDYRELIAASPFAKPVPRQPYRPSLNGVSDRVVIRGQPLKWSVTATGFDPAHGPPEFRLEPGAPADLRINPKSGEATWTPGASLKVGDYKVTVSAVQTGGASISKSARLTLRDANLPPKLEPIAAKTVYIGQPLAFVATGLDPDSSQRGVTYRLEEGAPSGAIIDSVSGQFRWETTLAQPAGDIELEVVCADSGDPPLEDRETVAISVRDDAARFTMLVGCLADSVNREALLYNQLEDKRAVLEEGSVFAVADIAGIVLAIEPESIIVQTADAQWKLRLGSNFRSMERLTSATASRAATSTD